MKKESMVGRRLYAWILDTILLFILVFVFDAFVSQPINNKVTNIIEVSSSYVEHSSMYEEIQDEYNIYIYDEAGNRLYNENVTETIKEEFLNDQRIINLNSILIEEQEQILINFIIRVSLSILVGSLVVYVILPIILKGGKTFGRFASKLLVVEENFDLVKWHKTLLRGIITIVVDIYLAILSIGIIPLISLITSVLHKDNKSLVDIICKTEVVDGKVDYFVNINGLKENKKEGDYNNEN